MNYQYANHGRKEDQEKILSCLLKSIMAKVLTVASIPT